MTEQEQVVMTEAEAEEEQRAVVVRDLNVTGTQLAQYGQREVVVELAKRMMMLHPQAKEVGKSAMMAVAQLAILIGANPLPNTNEIHVGKSQGRVFIDIGINFYERRARELGGILWVVKPRTMNAGERNMFAVEDTDLAAYCCAVRRDDWRELTKGGMTTVEVFEAVSEDGIGTVKRSATPKAGRPLVWTALKACRKDLYRKMFPTMMQRDTPQDKFAWLSEVRELAPLSGEEPIARIEGPELQEQFEKNVTMMRGDEDFEGFGDEEHRDDTGMSVKHQVEAAEELAEQAEPESKAEATMVPEVKAPYHMTAAVLWNKLAVDGIEFKHMTHMINTVRKGLNNPAWGWPAPEDKYGWDEAEAAIQLYRIEQAEAQDREVAAEVQSEMSV